MTATRRLDEPVPLPVESGEVLTLSVEHRGRVAMRYSLPALPFRDGGDVVTALTAHLTYRGPEGQHGHETAVLTSTVEDIAAWVQGDGTDAQCLAIADGIREWWQRQPTRQELLASADAADARASRALDAWHTVVADAGRTAPDPARWAETVAEAAREVGVRVEEQHQWLKANAAPDRAPSRDRMRTRVVPSESIPVHVDDVAGLAALVADLRHQLARAESSLARMQALRIDDQERNEREAARSTYLTPGEAAEIETRAWRETSALYGRQGGSAPVPQGPAQQAAPCRDCGARPRRYGALCAECVAGYGL